MAKKQDSLQTDFDNITSYKDENQTALDKELKLYEDFFQKVNHHAQTHRQITMNQLSEIEERLHHLRTEAIEIKNQLFYHDEYTIVDRQQMISDTEKRVGDENRSFYNSQFEDKKEMLDTIDYLNKALFQTKSNFFEEYELHYLQTILGHDEFYEYFMQAASSFQQVLESHQKEIVTLFYKLDDEIKKMDDSISEIIKRKNRTVSLNNHFYDEQMKYFIDNQLLFSAENDPTTIDIQALISDKIAQVETFEEYLKEEDQKLVQELQNEYQSLYDKILKRQLQRKSNLLIDNTDLFDQPQNYLESYQAKILAAHQTNKKTELKNYIRTYSSIKRYKKYQKSIEKKTINLLKPVEKEKKEKLLAYRLHSLSTMSTLNQYLDEYTDFMDIDPFYAQIIGDKSSKMIKDELNRLQILKANKELKVNIDYDIESLKIKNKINLVELQLQHEVKKHLLLQEQDLLVTIASLNLNLITNKKCVIKQYNEVKKESLQIAKIQEVIETHLHFLHALSNVTREMESKAVIQMIKEIRQDETHLIHVSDAASKIKLKLKEYDIKALHFKTMLENELSYLVIQSSRVDEENKVHNEFILTTYQNQMRFAEEQITLAEREYRLRGEAINSATEGEKQYFEDLIHRKMKKYESDLNQEQHEYEALLYHNRHILSETTDPKIHKILEKEAKSLKAKHDRFVEDMWKEISKDEMIASAKRRMMDLDEEALDALDDAKTLRDETLNQMASIYEDARQHYEVIKPYLDNKMNILDPDFFNHLERMNQRYDFKMKLSEASLDAETEQLIDDFKKIYFEEVPVVDKEVYNNMIATLSAKREQIRLSYQEKLTMIENRYQSEIAKIDQTLLDQYGKLDILANEELLIVENSKREINQELDALLLAYDEEKANLGEKLSTSTIQYMQEYQLSISNNKKYIDTLSSNFDKLLKSYQPYMNIIKKDRRVKMISTHHHHKYKRLERKGMNDIHRLIKNTTLKK
ncbi:MAG: hypothetical protein AB7U79_01825 [Candidatus Izemoplasmatales bacterium]